MKGLGEGHQSSLPGGHLNDPLLVRLLTELPRRRLINTEKGLDRVTVLVLERKGMAILDQLQKIKVKSADES